MKLEIKHRKKNPLMKREEAIVSIDHGGKPTPDRKAVLSEAAKLMKSKPESIIIDRIITAGGSNISEAKVFAYSKKDDIPAWRLKKMQQRMEKAKEKAEKKAEVQAAQPAPEAEAPAEEAASEEKPAEETPPEKEEETQEKPAEEPKQEKKEPDEGK